MRKLFGVIATASLIGLAGVAYAGDMTGAIKNVDTAKNMVTLDNGDTFDVAKGVNLSAFKVGQKVTVTYTQSGKTMDATALKTAS